MAELDERDERVEETADARELVLRLGRLHEPRVVLEQDAAQLSRQLERLDRRAEVGERLGLVGRLVVRHRGVGLHVEDELGRRALRPAAGHGRVREVVEGRVDLDRVEALRVVGESRRRSRDAARVPRLEQPLVGEAARPQANGRGHGWSDRLIRAECVLLATVLLAGGSACGGADVGSERQLRVLFVGNSLTATNDLPAAVRALAAQAGPRPVDTRTVAPGVSLEEHWRSTGARQALEGRPWDAVVLQQGPSSLPESRAHLQTWTRRWADEVRAHDARPALLGMWPEAQGRDALRPRSPPMPRPPRRPERCCCRPGRPGRRLAARGAPRALRAGRLLRASSGPRSRHSSSTPGSPASIPELPVDADDGDASVLQTAAAEARSRPPGMTRRAYLVTGGTQAGFGEHGRPDSHARARGRRRDVEIEDVRARLRRRRRREGQREA